MTIASGVFVLNEDPDEVEALYQTPLPLSERLYCRTKAEI